MHPSLCSLTVQQLQQRKGPKKEYSGNKREMKEKEELEKVAASPADMGAAMVRAIEHKHKNKKK